MTLLPTETSPSLLLPYFISAGATAGVLDGLSLDSASPAEVLTAIGGLPFNTIYDYLRAATRQLVENGNAETAISAIEALDNSLGSDATSDRALLDLHTALMQLLVSLHAYTGDSNAALSAAASTLTLLAQEPKRKDEPFLSVLASLLYDLGLIHYSRGEFPQSERSLDKAARIFSRLARINAERYAPAHVATLDAAAKVCRKAGDQAEALKKCQETTARYLEETREGAMDEAVVRRLADSMAEQGLTLAKMGRNREAIQFISRALRYLTRLQPEMDMRQLTLSTELGICLLLHKPTRDKGIHLLNTMLHKATRLGAPELHRRIVDVLADARNPARLDILGVWHKIFPR